MLADWVKLKRNPNTRIWEDMSSQQVLLFVDQVDCSIYLPNEWNIPQIS